MMLVVLVDCDIHVGYESVADLLPYLDPPTRELVIASGTNGLAMPSYPWNHPTGWFRHDVYERSAAHDANFAYLSLDLLRERHLDLYATGGQGRKEETHMAHALLLESLATIRRKAKFLAVSFGVGLLVAAAVALLCGTVLLDYLLNLAPEARLTLIAAAFVVLGY